MPQRPDMSSLISRIRQVPAARPAFLYQAETISFGDLIAEYEQCGFARLMPQALVLSGLSYLELAKAILMLDGCAKRVLLIPEGFDPEVFAQFKIQLEIVAEVRTWQEVIDLGRTSSVATDHPLPESQVTEWIIPTSGTTGTPKLISHTVANLSASSIVDISRGEEFIWGLSYNPYRFAGIQVLLQALLSGSALVIPGSLKLDSMLEDFARAKCNALSGTPTFWRSFLMHDVSLPLKRITLGGEICEQRLLSALKARFNQARIVHIYASTEVGVGFAVKDASAGFPLAYVREGVNGNKLKVSEQGLLWIKPQTMQQKFYSDAIPIDADGFICTGDLVEIVDERVYFLGRDSGAINIGGNKVIPEEVEAKIMELDEVALALVYGKSNPITGQLVAANIELSGALAAQDTKAIKTRIQQKCRTELADYKTPVLIKFVEKIPLNSAGKVDRGSV